MLLDCGILLSQGLDLKTKTLTRKWTVHMSDLLLDENVPIVCLYEPPCWVYWVNWRHVIEFVFFDLLSRYRHVYNYLAVIVSP